MLTIDDTAFQPPASTKDHPETEQQAIIHNIWGVYSGVAVRGVGEDNESMTIWKRADTMEIRFLDRMPRLRAVARAVDDDCERYVAWTYTYADIGLWLLAGSRLCASWMRLVRVLHVVHQYGSTVCSVCGRGFCRVAR